MSYDSIEQSGTAQPFEIYSFQGTGVSHLLTSSEEEVTYLGEVYAPTTISRTEVEMSNEVVSGQLKITIPGTHPLAGLLLPYLPNAPIAVTVIGSHYGDGNAAVIFTGTVDSAKFDDKGQCELTCNSAQYKLQRKIPTQLYQAPCSHIFGDQFCTVDLALHTYNGTVSAIDSTGTVITVPAFGSLPDPLKAGYLRLGNDLRMIVDQSGDVITLLSPMIGLQVGSAVSGTAGCNLDFPSCSHYANTFNFLGFDLIPSVNPFDGSASVG